MSDTAPTADGGVGQVISHAHETGDHKLLSQSLADYLQDLAMKVEQGQFVYDDQYGLCPASSSGEDYWGVNRTTFLRACRSGTTQMHCAPGNRHSRIRTTLYALPILSASRAGLTNSQRLALRSQGRRLQRRDNKPLHLTAAAHAGSGSRPLCSGGR